MTMYALKEILKDSFVYQSMPSSNIFDLSAVPIHTLKMSIRNNVIETLLLKDPVKYFNWKALTYNEIVTIIKSRPELLKKLPNIQLTTYTKRALLRHDPEKFRKIFPDVNINKGDLDELMITSPASYFKQGWTCEKIGYDGWRYLLKHNNNKYKDLFLENIHLIRNKTELKDLFHGRVSIGMRVTPEHVDKCILSAKEFIAMIVSSHRWDPTNRFYITPDLKDYLVKSLFVETMSIKMTHQMKTNLKTLDSLVKDK